MVALGLLVDRLVTELSRLVFVLRLIPLLFYPMEHNDPLVGLYACFSCFSCLLFSNRHGHHIPARFSYDFRATFFTRLRRRRLKVLPEGLNPGSPAPRPSRTLPVKYPTADEYSIFSFASPPTFIRIVVGNSTTLISRGHLVCCLFPETNIINILVSNAATQATALMSVDTRQSLTCLRYPSRFETVSRTQLSKAHTGDSTRPLDTP